MSVFVVQQPKPGKQGFTYDISPALEFGQPVFVFEATEQPGLTPGPSLHKVRRLMANFSDKDYILWAGGDPFGLAVVTSVALEINQGRLNFLRWERERDENNQRNGRGYYMTVSFNTRGK
jgi:hypothetical protein